MKTIRENDILFGWFRIIRELSRNNKGTIYLAWHLKLDKYAVVKRTHRLGLSESELRKEADILKKLSHQNLPMVYLYEYEDGEAFTVLDYIEGKDLTCIKPGIESISEGMILYWLDQLCSVLDYLHTRKIQIIHSDIKPANIILRRDNTVCLIDFNVSLEKNTDQSVKGFSEYYASPEQIRLFEDVQSGKTPKYHLDVTTDIYSLGSTFYYLMTGTLPDPRGRTPRLQDNGGYGYSDVLCRVIDKCMEHDRRKRYQSARSLRKAIQELYKSDVRYRQYILLRVSSIMLCGFMAAVGVFFIARGWKDMLVEKYMKDYNVITGLYSEGEFVAAGIKSRELINNSDYEYIGDLTHKQRANILYIMGEINYEGKDYIAASYYYRDGLEEARKARIDLNVFYRDYAIATAKCGDISLAQDIVARAEKDGISDASLKLMQATLYAQNADPNNSIIAINSILSMDTDAEVKARACCEAAQLYRDSGDIKSEIEWLELAVQYHRSESILRQLAEAYIALMKDRYTSPSARTVYAQKSAALYSELNATHRMSIVDYTNYSSILIDLKMYSEARTMLMGVVDTSQTSFPLCYNLAYVCHMTGDETGASRYSSMAYNQYALLNDEEKQEYVVEYSGLERLAASLRKG